MVKTNSISKLTHHASALVSFANTNEEFAQKLYAHSVEFKNEELAEVHITPSKYLVPKNINEAEARLLWLIQELNFFNHKNNIEAQAILQTWTKNYEGPKDLVLGIVGVAIIGPTLGLIQKKKKRKSQMRVVVLESELQKNQNHSLSIIQQASTALLANELATVNGNAYRLEPDMAEWLFVEQETKTTSATNEQLLETKQVLENESLPHFVLLSEDKIIAIAIAPCVSDEIEAGELTEF